jgi:hypothetical protein
MRRASVVPGARHAAKIAAISVAAMLAAACQERAASPHQANERVSREQQQRPAPDAAIRNPRVAAAVQRIVAVDDAQGLPFFVIDKKTAVLYAFDRNAKLRGRSDVLLGSAPGDHTVPGVGELAIEQVPPEARTTPAGRFVGVPGRNARNEDVVWVDYDAAVSMHRVITTNPHERRLERLRSATPDDNRISYGCINVWPEFYETYVRPAYQGQRPPIYILPEIEDFDSVIQLRGAAPERASH